MLRFAYYLIITAFTSVAMPAHAFSDIQFQDENQKTLSLDAFKGKPVVLNLWASWCGPCASEMPSLALLQSDYKSKGLVVLALSEDNSIRAVTRFYQENSLNTLTPYIDTDHKAMYAFHSRGIPTSALINRQGDIVKIIEGPVNWQSPDIIKEIAAIMSETGGK